MENKTKKISELLKSDKRKALSIASKFFDRSDDTKLFKKANDALNNSEFYKSIGVDIVELEKMAYKRLEEKFG